MGQMLTEKHLFYSKFPINQHLTGTIVWKKYPGVKAIWRSRPRTVS